MKLSMNQYETLMSQAADKMAELQDELTRLRVVNAELVKALGECKLWHQGDKWREEPGVHFRSWALQMTMIDAALAKAME